MILSLFLICVAHSKVFQNLENVFIGTDTEFFLKIFHRPCPHSNTTPSGYGVDKRIQGMGTI